MRYVLALRKNLISLGASESKGLKMTMEDIICKVTKGFRVIMKGVRDRNLYYLKGSTVTGTLTTSVRSEGETNRLWHMRLGYLGEKFLQALVRQYLLKGAKTCKLDFCEHWVLGKRPR